MSFLRATILELTTISAIIYEPLLNETYGSQGSKRYSLLLPLVHTKYLSYEKKARH